jgi:hypothetical protein
MQCSGFQEIEERVCIMEETINLTVQVHFRDLQFFKTTSMLVLSSLRELTIAAAASIWQYAIKRETLAQCNL